MEPEAVRRPRGGHSRKPSWEGKEVPARVLAGLPPGSEGVARDGPWESSQSPGDVWWAEARWPGPRSAWVLGA